MASTMLRTQFPKHLNQIRFFSSTNPLNRIENVLILGSGLMGSGIAQSCAQSGKFNSIVMQDVSDELLAKAKGRIQQSVTKLAEKKRINIGNASPEQVVSRITLSTEVKPKSQENLLVIEAVPEKLELKQEIFKKLSSQFKSNPTVILATNTSGLPCSKINIHVEQKDRFAGLHFFNPVPLMKLVEIAKCLDTTQATIDSLKQFVQDIDHVGVQCKDTPKFIVNRLLGPYMQDALKMFEAGLASFEDIDTAMKLGAGYPMGPFELLDYVGLDTHKLVADSYAKDGVEVFYSKKLDQLVAQGHLGRKTGKGFYNWSPTGQIIKK